MNIGVQICQLHFQFLVNILLSNANYSFKTRHPFRMRDSSSVVCGALENKVGNINVQNLFPLEF